MTWYRQDEGMEQHPKMLFLAERLADSAHIPQSLRGSSVVQCVGHVSILFGKVAKYVPSGNLSSVSDRTLEQWACWSGPSGEFAEAFREIWISEGTITGWMKRNGKLFERMEKDRQRHRVENPPQEPLRKICGASAEKSVLRNGTVRNVTKEQLPLQPQPEVALVLEHYKALHPNRRPGEKERAIVARAMRLGYSAAELCEAITGNAKDPWHAERRKHELEYVLRNNGKIDEFRDQGAPFVPKMTEEEWLDGDPIQTMDYGLTEKGDLMLNEKRKAEWIREQRRCGMIP